VVDAEAAQGAVQRVQQGAPGRAAAERAVVPPCDGLRGDHQLLARHEVVEQAAQDALALAAGVHVGGVHEGAAEVGEGHELARGLVGVGVLAPGHRAQADPGHPQPAVAEVSLLHRAKSTGSVAFSLADTPTQWIDGDVTRR
jgi:hypothetical protein